MKLRTTCSSTKSNSKASTKTLIITEAGDAPHAVYPLFLLMSEKPRKVWRLSELFVSLQKKELGDVKTTPDILRQLMKIALFDFWIANEDRNANNANLLYDVGRGRLISIDYGCILNTATFDYAMTQLTTTDTILWSDLFHYLAKSKDNATIENIAENIKEQYVYWLKRSQKQVDLILEELPNEWNVPRIVVEEKLKQLFDRQWTDEVWKNYIECLKENTEYGEVKI